MKKLFALLIAAALALCLLPAPALASAADVYTAEELDAAVSLGASRINVLGSFSVGTYSLADTEITVAPGAQLTLEETFKMTRGALDIGGVLSTRGGVHFVDLTACPLTLREGANLNLRCTLQAHQGSDLMINGTLANNASIAAYSSVIEVGATGQFINDGSARAGSALKISGLFMNNASLYLCSEIGLYGGGELLDALGGGVVTAGATAGLAPDTEHRVFYDGGAPLEEIAKYEYHFTDEGGVWTRGEKAAAIYAVASDMEGFTEALCDPDVSVIDIDGAITADGVFDAEPTDSVVNVQRGASLAVSGELTLRCACVYNHGRIDILPGTVYSQKNGEHGYTSLFNCGEVYIEGELDFKPKTGMIFNEAYLTVAQSGTLQAGSDDAQSSAEIVNYTSGAMRNDGCIVCCGNFSNLGSVINDGLLCPHGDVFATKEASMTGEGRVFTGESTAYNDNGGDDPSARIFFDRPGGKAILGSIASSEFKYVDGQWVLCSLAAPVLTYVGTGTEALTLRWTAVTGADGYLLYRRAEGTAAWENVARTYTGRKFTDSGLRLGAFYEYKVAAVNSTSINARKESAVLRTRVRPRTPEITGMSAAPGAVRLTWRAAGEPGERFRVLRFDLETRRWRGVALTERTSFTDRDTRAGGTYYYRVQTYVSAGGVNYFSLCSARADAYL